MYVGFITKKHELHVLEKKNKSVAAIGTQRMLKNMLESNERFYYFLAIKELLSEEECNRIAYIDSMAKIRKLEEPNLEDINELLSYGLIMKEGENTRFKHRSFAEFFYARLMTDRNGTLYKLRDALYVFGYKSGENIANFVSSALDGKDLLDLLSTFVQVKVIWEQKNPLFEYHTSSSKLEIHKWFIAAMEATITGRSSSSSYQLFKAIARSPANSLLELIMHHKNQYEMKFKGSSTEETTTSVWDFLPTNLDRDKYHKASTLSTLLKPPKNRIHSNFQLEGNLIKDIDWILDNISACWMIIDVFSREELTYLFTNEDTRITDMVGKKVSKAYRSFGEDFIQTNLVRFRCKHGDDIGKSFFELDSLSELDINFALRENNSFEYRDVLNLLTKETDFQLIRYLARFDLLAKEECLAMKPTLFSRCANAANYLEKLVFSVSSIITEENLWELAVQRNLTWHSVCYLAVNYAIKNNVDQSLMFWNGPIPIKDIYDFIHCAKFFLFAANLPISHQPDVLTNYFTTMHDWKLVDEDLKELVLILSEATLQELVKLSQQENIRRSNTLFHYTNLPVLEIIIALIQRHMKHNKKLKERSWTQLFLGILRPKGSWVGCCKVKKLLLSFQTTINDDETVKSLLLENSVKIALMHAIEDKRWSTFIQKSHHGNNCFLKQILAFYFDVFKDDSDSLRWMRRGTSGIISLAATC